MVVLQAAVAAIIVRLQAATFVRRESGTCLNECNPVLQ